MGKTSRLIQAVRIDFFSILSFFFVFSANMNLAMFAGILLAVPMATARRVSLGEKNMQATGEADEPDEAMRGAARPARLVVKIVQTADEADEPDEAMRGSARPARWVEKIIRAADKADEPEEANCLKEASCFKSGSCIAKEGVCKKYGECCTGYCQKVGIFKHCLWNPCGIVEWWGCWDVPAELWNGGGVMMS